MNTRQIITAIKKQPHVVAVAVCILVLIIAAYIATGASKSKIVLLGQNGTEVSLKVEVADDEAERAAGLMDRDYLAKNSGMLFVFSQPQMLSFWMKNTHIPLDIIFFDGEGDFVSTLSMEPCEIAPCPSYKSPSFAQYALEVNQGFVEEHGIRVGWKLRWNDVPALSQDNR